ncbi:MAG: hypothetical protein ACREOO_14400 [bacterium]
MTREREKLKMANGLHQFSVKLKTEAAARPVLFRQDLQDEQD